MAKTTPGEGEQRHPTPAPPRERRALPFETRGVPPGNDGHLTIPPSHSFADPASPEIAAAREMADASLLESALAAGSLLDVLPAPVLVALDPHCARIVGNRAAAQLFRLGQDANISKSAPAGQAPMNFRLFRNGHELAPEELPLQRACRNLGAESYELEIVFDDGSRRYVRGHARPLFAEGGAIFGAIATCDDITEDRLTHESLRRSEEEFRAIFELEFVGKVQAVNNRFTRVNKKFREIFGYSEQELLGKEALALSHPEDAALDRLFYEKLVSGEIEAYEIEKRCVRKDGGLIWIHANFRALTGGRWVATVRDVTARRRIEAERAQALALLAEQKKQLAVTLDSIADGVIAIDDQGAVVLMNGVAKTLTGWMAADPAGRPLKEVCCIVSTTSECLCVGMLGDCFDGETSVDLPPGSLLRCLDGQERPVAGKISPIIDKSERLGAVIVFRDMTEQRQREEERLKTQRLESLGILAGGIAHDFNNILTALFGNIQLARLCMNIEDPAQESLREAENALSRARNLSQQLLTFAKGGAPIRKTASIKELLIETTALSLRALNVQREFDIDDDLWPVKFDDGQMSRVIANIAINASQAMPDGGRFRVEARNALLPPDNAFGLPPGRHVEIRFKDWGVGIPPEHQARIFDPYFTTKNAGNGLGLSTAYSIVKRHEGCITVDSKVGRGSTFTVYLPADHSEPNEAGSKEARVMSGRVLVMDDDPGVRQVASGLLQWLGYETRAVKDGEEALREYEQAQRQGAPFAAVILDLTVPGGMGGVECLHQLKEIDPDVKALVSSGYSNDPIMAAYREQGFAGVVTKPYSVIDLGGALSALFGGS